MPKSTIQRLFLAIIAAGYLLVGSAFAVFTPDWQAPDEPAHYNYIAQVATERRIPVIQMGDWDHDYLEALKANRFAPDMLDNIATVRYENHQPPLYYLLAAPVYLLTGGSLTALRLFSVVIGFIIVFSAYYVGLLMYPSRPWIGLGAAAMVAFLPQHVHILASVNNDALAWALIGIALVAIIAYLKQTPLAGRPVQPWHLGLIVGTALITKTTAYFLAAVVPLAILLRWWITSRHAATGTKTLLRALALFLIPALVLGGMWWLRNISVYGFPDFLGLAAHDAVVIGQPRTAEAIETLGIGGYLEKAINTTFNSFWGQFGWMALPLPAHLYSVTIAGLTFALAGWVIDLSILRHREEATPPEQRSVWLILALTTVLSILAFIYYNTEFEQHQGRYLFPLLIPLALVLALGVDGWRQLVMERIINPGTQDGQNPRLVVYFPWLTVIVFLPLALVDLWLLWRVVVPNLQP
jgi:4-amino-4-deoxy-L-arabinose transferase-like glycosyltransferase